MVASDGAGKSSFPHITNGAYHWLIMYTDTVLVDPTPAHKQ